MVYNLGSAKIFYRSISRIFHGYIYINKSGQNSFRQLKLLELDRK